MKRLLWLFAGISWSASAVVILMNPGSKLAFLTGVLINILGGRAWHDLFDWLMRRREVVEVSEDELKQLVEACQRHSALLHRLSDIRPSYPSYPKDGGRA